MCVRVVFGELGPSVGLIAGVGTVGGDRQRAGMR